MFETSGGMRFSYAQWNATYNTYSYDIAAMEYATNVRCSSFPKPKTKGAERSQYRCLQ